MLALIIFSFLIGFACLRSGERAPRDFLSSGDEVMKQLLHLIMKTLNRIRLISLIKLGFFPLFGAIWSWCFYFVVFLASMHLLREGQMG
jgi:Na+/H+-dicarboxylate symporter